MLYPRVRFLDFYFALYYQCNWTLRLLKAKAQPWRQFQLTWILLSTVVQRFIFFRTNVYFPVSISAKKKIEPSLDSTVAILTWRKSTIYVLRTSLGNFLKIPIEATASGGGPMINLCSCGCHVDAALLVFYRGIARCSLSMGSLGKVGTDLS